MLLEYFFLFSSKSFFGSSNELISFFKTFSKGFKVKSRLSTIFFIPSCCSLTSSGTLFKIVKIFDIFKFLFIVLSFFILNVNFDNLS